MKDVTSNLDWLICTFCRGSNITDCQASSRFNRWYSIVGVVIINGMSQQPFGLAMVLLGRVGGYQAKNSGQEAPHGCLQTWPKHVCGLSVTFLQ